MRNQSLGLNYYLCPEGHVILIKGKFRVETLERVVGKHCVKGILSGLIEDELAMIYIENTKRFEEIAQKIFEDLTAQYKGNDILMDIGDDYKIELVSRVMKKLYLP